MPEPGDIHFQRMEAADLPLMDAWLRREHVRKWWNEDETYEDVAKHYLPAIEDREPADLYLITLDARPIGFIQTYLVSDYPTWEAVVQAGAGVAGVDLFIAEAELTGRGLGTAVLRRFVREIVFSALSTSACVADPDAANAASIRAFEKAGFRRVRDFLDPGDGKTHTLMRLDRNNNGR